jgi:SAM-dependent methyltransferase
MTARTSVFEHYAGDYDAWFDTFPQVYATQLRLLRTFIPDKGTGLEVGVGSGRFASPLGIVHGLDPSLSLLAVARQRGVETVAGLGEFLPYRNGSFDYVLMMTVICFLNHIGRPFCEVCRILKPGGILVVAFLEKGGEIAERERAQKPKGRFLSHATFRSADEVTVALAGSGFSEVAVVHNKKGFCIVTARKC